MQYFYFSWFEALHRETIVNWKTTNAVWIVWESRLTFDRKFVVKKSWWNTPNVHEFNLFVLCLSFFFLSFVLCRLSKMEKQTRNSIGFSFESRRGLKKPFIVFMLSCMSVCDLSFRLFLCNLCEEWTVFQQIQQNQKKILKQNKIKQNNKSSQWKQTQHRILVTLCHRFIR